MKMRKYLWIEREIHKKPLNVITLSYTKSDNIPTFISNATLVMLSLQAPENYNQ
jgi:hypothetical protein